MIKELEDDIVVFTLTENFTGFSEKNFEYLKLNKNDIILFLKKISYKNIIEHLIKLNHFQISINRVLVIVPKNEKEVNFHSKLNLIKSVKEGIDFIMFEKIQRNL